VLTGQRLSHLINSQRYFRPWHLLRLRSYVVKFVTANMMLPWLCETFDLRAVFMVRHPCAVVSSQLVHGAWDGVSKSFCHHEALFDDYPHLGPIYDGLASLEETLAFNWAIQNVVPLAAPPPQPWLTTTYERLAEDGPREMARVLHGLGETPTDATQALLHTPSATTVARSNVKRGGSLLTGWRDRLTSRQVDRILRVTHAVGIVGYTDDLRPSAPMLAPIVHA
jgi:hypothetical protein